MNIKIERSSFPFYIFNKKPFLLKKSTNDFSNNFHICDLSLPKLITFIPYDVTIHYVKNYNWPSKVGKIIRFFHFFGVFWFFINNVRYMYLRFLQKVFLGSH